MSQEIVFTSARRGLRTGSTGFCTVQSTRGMPGNLAQLLERLTGYTHVFDAYGDQAHLNPVNFAHYIVRLGDQRFHILGRVANAPLDHTNRSNKLAHLLAVDSSQIETQLSADPAAESMEIPWVSVWSSDKDPCVLHDDRQIDVPKADQPKSGPCSLWKEATGDARWAAVLAATAGESSSPFQVILPRNVGSLPETWALQLVHEALSLVPPASRWDVSYSTFFGGNLPVSVNCQWQFVLDGTDAAQRARLDPRGRTIDIPSIKAEEKQAPARPMTAFTTVATRPWDNDSVDSAIAKRRSGGSDRRPLPEAPEVSSPGDGEEGQTETRNQSPVGKKDAGISSDVSVRRSEKKGLPLLLRPVSLTVMLLVIAAVVAILVYQRSSPDKFEKLQEIVRSSTSESRSVRANRERKQQRELEAQKKKDEEAEKQRQKQEEEDKQKRLAAMPEATENAAAPDANPDDVPKQVVETKSKEPLPPPLQEIRRQENRLELKLPDPATISGSNSPIHLAKIHVTKLEHFKLNRIIGGQSVLDGRDFALKLKDTKGEPFREWEVIRKSTSGIDVGGNPDVVGTFRLDQNTNQNADLSFRWDKKNRGYEIINCLLEMEAKEPGTKPDREKCTLREVSRVKPIRFDFKSAKTVEHLVTRNQLTNTQALELRSDFMNPPGQVTRRDMGFKPVGDPVRFQIQGPQTGKYPRTVEISVTLVKGEQEHSAGIEMEAELELPILEPGAGQLKIKSVPFTLRLMQDTDANIVTFGRLIEDNSKLLKSKREERNDVSSRKGPKRDEQVKRLDDEIRTLESILKAQELEIIELKALIHDLKKMLEDIAMNGHLHFSLRLMIRDGGEKGILLMETDDVTH